MTKMKIEITLKDKNLAAQIKALVEGGGGVFKEIKSVGDKVLGSDLLEYARLSALGWPDGAEEDYDFEIEGIWSAGFEAGGAPIAPEEVYSIKGLVDIAIMYPEEWGTFKIKIGDVDISTREPTHKLLLKKWLAGRRG